MLLLPALLPACFGPHDSIDCPRVHDRMNRWPGGALDVLPGAEHEVLMETPALRTRVYDRMNALFTHGETGVSEPLSA